MAELTNAKALRVRFVYPLAATLFRVVDVAGVAKSDSTNLEGILPGSRCCLYCCSGAQCAKITFKLQKNMQLDYLVTFDTLFLSTIQPSFMEHNTNA